MTNQNVQLFDSKGNCYQQDVKAGVVVHVNEQSALGFVQVKSAHQTPINYCFSFSQVFQKQARVNIREKQNVLFQTDDKGCVLTLKVINN